MDGVRIKYTVVSHDRVTIKAFDENNVVLFSTDAGITRYSNEGVMDFTDRVKATAEQMARKEITKREEVRDLKAILEGK